MKDKLRDRVSYFIASHLPKRVLYFCIVYIWSILTTRVYTNLSPDEIDIFMAMKGIHEKYDLDR